MSRTEAIKKIAYINKKAIYNTQKNELIFKANYITDKGFRLVHDSEKVIVLIEGTDTTITTTIHEVEEFKTEKEILDRIEELGLEYNIKGLEL